MPILCEVAMGFIAVPATSTFVEATFSSTKAIEQDRHNMAEDTFTAWTFLRVNRKYM